MSVFIELPGHEGFAGLEDVHHAPAVGHGQHIEPELALARGKRLRARAHGDQRIARRVVEEGVDLVCVRSLGDQVGDVSQRRREVGGGQAQQRLEHFHETLRTGGLLIQRVCDSAERRFVSGFYAELA